MIAVSLGSTAATRASMAARAFVLALAALVALPAFASAADVCSDVDAKGRFYRLGQRPDRVVDDPVDDGRCVDPNDRDRLVFTRGLLGQRARHRRHPQACDDGRQKEPIQVQLSLSR